LPPQRTHSPLRTSARVAEYIIDMGYAGEELPVIVTAFAELVGDLDADNAALALMQARLANSERDGATRSNSPNLPASSRAIARPPICCAPMPWPA
jgi:hypothetical protein